MSRAIRAAQDDPRVQRITVRDLKSPGYEAIEAEDASVSREIMQTADGIYLPLSNVLMPGDMDGLQVAEWAAATHSTPDIAVKDSSLPGSGPVPFRGPAADHGCDGSQQVPRRRLTWTELARARPRPPDAVDSTVHVHTEARGQACP